VEADSLGIDSQTRAVLARVASFVDAESLEAYVVGGFLRDALLGRESHDVDVAVAADPLSLGRQLADALAGHFFPLHEEHKAGRIVLADSEAVRRIDLVPLRVDIEADLAQRDLTINAMAVPVEALAGEQQPSIIDPYGGRRDLAEGIVRMVRPETFRADPLRLLRAVRLGAELGFTVEPQTAAVMAENAPLLSQAAPERQRDELMHILATPRAAPGLRLADELGLLEPLVPEVTATRGEEQPKEHQWDVFDHSLETVAALDVLLGSEEPADGRWARLWRELWEKMEEFPAVGEHFQEEVSEGHTRVALLKLAALLHDIAKPETRTIDENERMRFFGHAQAGAARAAAVARRLRFSRAEVRQTEAMVKEHLRPLQIARDGPPSRRALYRYFRDTGEAAIDVLFLSLADHLATVGPRLDWDDWQAHLNVVGFILAWRFQEELAAPSRLVTGHDLMDALGLAPGPLVGRLLEAVQEAQAAGEVTTREQALALAHQELERMEARP
jgi:poly(A) polymerase